MKDRENQKKLYVLGIGMIVFLIILILFYSLHRDNGFNAYKQDKRQYIVYDAYSYQDNHIPRINLKGEEIQAINLLIEQKADQFLKEKSNVISYRYDLNGSILSLAVQYINQEDSYPVVSYDVYHINVYNNHLYTNEEILSLYPVSMEDVSSLAEAKFKEFYLDLFEKGYFDEECDYACFLFMRGIENEDYLADSHFYIIDGNLYLLKSFQIYSPFQEENYFSFQDFLIQITE